MTLVVNCSDIELHMQSDSRHGLAFFEDLSKNRYTFRRVGGVIHSTSQRFTGTTSFFSPSSDSDYLRVEGVKENFNFIHHGSTGWTIQTWCYLSSVNTTSSTIMSNSWNGVSHDGFRFYIDHSDNNSKPTFTTYVNWTSSQGYKSSEITTSTNIPIQTWVHLAVVYDKDNEKFAIYVDGQNKTSGSTTWLQNRSVRTAGKSLDIFRNDDETPDAFHGFLQDVQILNKPIYLGNFNKQNELLFDRCSPARINLKIPGRPEYIYFYDGTTTKCYRKTNQRVYDGGLTLTESQIASSVDEHEAFKASKPVLIYDSCEQCLGLAEFFIISSFGSIIRYGSVDVTEVQNMTPGAPLVDIDTYTVRNTAITVTIDDIATVEEYYPDNPITSPSKDLYKTGMITCTVTVPNIARFVPGVVEVDPTDIRAGQSIMSATSRPANRVLTCTVMVGAPNAIDSAFPGVDASNIIANSHVRREGTASHPAPPDAHDYDAEEKEIIPVSFKQANNPGSWVSFT